MLLNAKGCTESGEWDSHSSFPVPSTLSKISNAFSTSPSKSLQITCSTCASLSCKRVNGGHDAFLVLLCQAGLKLSPYCVQAQVGAAKNQQQYARPLPLTAVQDSTCKSLNKIDLDKSVRLYHLTHLGSDKTVVQSITWSTSVLVRHSMTCLT